MYRLIGITVLLVAWLAAPVDGQGQSPGQSPERSGTPVAATVGSEYRLGAEDVLSIQVWGKPELSGSVTVDFSGRIQIPLLGEIRAEGRTPAQLSEDLTSRMQLLDPSVSEVLVSVTEYNSRSVTVLGEVRNPGLYGFREMPDLWEALLTAGGPGPKAELSRVQVVRGERAAGEPYTITVDLSGGIDGTPVETLPALRPKDRILVPSAEDVPVGGENFHVLGAVKAPGVYRIATARTVVEALSVSGGPLSNAELKRVYLTRLTGVGAISYRLDLEKYLYEAQSGVNLELQAGDTITVPEKSSFFTSFTEGIGRFAPFLSLAVTVILATR